MSKERATESEEILEFHFASAERREEDFSYNEAVMDENISELICENPEECEKPST